MESPYRSSKAVTKRQEIGSSIYLYTINETKPISVTYVVENAAFENVEIMLSFDGSENIKLGDDEGVLEAAAVVPSYGRKKVVTANVVDPYQSTTLKISFHIKYLQFDEAHLAVLRDHDDRCVEAAISNFSVSTFRPEYFSPKDIHDVCIEYGIQYVDPLSRKLNNVISGVFICWGSERLLMILCK